MLRITLLRFQEPAMPELPNAKTPPATSAEPAAKDTPKTPQQVEIGGRGGLDPTRYGDWEKNGRCIDF